MNRSWEAVSNQPDPSWYLDPLVAAQKRDTHRRLVERWTRGLGIRTVLKTDLFEEAFGDDLLLFDLIPEATHVVGIDVAFGTVQRAGARCGQRGFSFVATDVRSLAFRSAAFDLVFSNSTLDHFDSEAELRSALAELVRTVRPGGTLIVTLDNPWNPLYPALRWLSRRDGITPYVLGATLPPDELVPLLRDLGLEVTGQDWLIHNPRLLSTILFLALRRILHTRADFLIGALLGLFAALGRLPSRRFTACFFAVCARKPPI